MAAFDVTTKPTRLSLKPGETGTIMVVVSNRLGKPVMALVEGNLDPPSVARWLVPPADPQRRFQADPAATLTYDFKIAVPKDATTQEAQFKAIARDVMAPDDTRTDGQTVAIDVTGGPTKPPKRAIPWWIWVVAAVVLLGVGVGLYLLLRPKAKGTPVPDVVGMTAEKAREELTKAGFAQITVKDTLAKDKDTNTVVRQEPLPMSNLPQDSERERTEATIVVNKAKPPRRGDGRLELAYWRSSAARFYVMPSSTPTTYETSLGVENDFPVVRDYDGDGYSDLAVYSSTTSTWLILRSSDDSLMTKQWGNPEEDFPAPADYDGDGQADLAVVRGSTLTWWVLKSSDSTNMKKEGVVAGLPFPADYDGDKKADYMMWQAPNTWRLIRSTGGAPQERQFGIYGDWPVPADYDGDGRTDIAVWRRSSSEWHIIPSRGGANIVKVWGQPGGRPLTGDYDGDGKADFMMFNDGEWKLLKSSDGTPTTRRWGQPADSPTPGDFD